MTTTSTFWQPLTDGTADVTSDLLVLDGVVPLEPVGNDDDANDWLYTDTEDA